MELLPSWRQTCSHYPERQKQGLSLTPFRHTKCSTTMHGNIFQYQDPTPLTVLFHQQSLGPLAGALVPLYQVLICGALVPSVTWDLGRPRYVRPISHPSYVGFRKTLCGKLAHESTYIASIVASKLRNWRHNLKVSLARSYPRRHEVVVQPTGRSYTFLGNRAWRDALRRSSLIVVSQTQLDD